MVTLILIGLVRIFKNDKLRNYWNSEGTDKVKRKAIERIVHHIEMINEYMKPISNLNEFNNNSIIQDAVVFNFLQIYIDFRSYFTDFFFYGKIIKRE